MSGAWGSSGDADLLRASGQEAQPPAGGSGWTTVLGYSVASGAIATAVGAAVSLVVSGSARLAVWCVATAVLSAAAGLVSESAAVSSCRSVCRRWLSRLASS